MAPEMIANTFKEGDNSYDSRIDVWALGNNRIDQCSILTCDTIFP